VSPKDNLSHILYNIYGSDQLTIPNTLIAIYADDKAILSIHPDPSITIQNLQSHLTLNIGIQSGDLKLTIQNLSIQCSLSDLTPAVTSLFMAHKFQMLELTLVDLDPAYKT